MADFSTQATSISSPNIGATPIAPVQAVRVPDQTTSLFANAIKQAGEIWEVTAKQKAQEQKTTVLGEYAREREKINNGLTSGKIDPTRASTLIRALNTRYLAGNTQYTEELTKLNNAFNGSTESEEVIDETKLARDLKNRDIEEVRSRGGMIYPGMPQYAVDSQINATKTAIRAEREFEATSKRNAEARAQGDYDAKIAEREMKEQGVKLLTDIAGANLDSFQKLGQSLVENMKSGKLNADQAQQTLRAEWSRISSYITAAGTKNTELISPFKSLFDNIGELYQKQLDPKASTENLENELKQIKAKAQLVLLANPKVRAATAASELLGPNAQIALAAANPVVDEITKLISTPPDSVIPAPQIVGNPDAEKDVFKFLNDSLLKLDTGAYKDNDKAKNEAQTGVNNVLGQVGGLLDKGNQSPVQFKATADFLASPAFGRGASQGLFDAGAMQTAKKVFQLQYEDVVIRGIQQKMDRVFLSTKGSVPAPTIAAGGAGNPGSQAPKSKETTKKINDLIAIEYTGTGVQFVGKKGAAKTEEDIREQRNTLADLKTVQTAVNQLVKIGAHMEGTMDYQSYWEENKHRIFPEAGFPLPQASPKNIGGSLKTEKDVKDAARLNPSEQARSDQFEQSDANLRELETELRRGDLSPSVRAILEQEYKSLLGKRGAR